MRSMLELLGLAVVLFVSTNIDDVFVLVGFFADSKMRPGSVVIGQYLGIGILFAGSVVACLFSMIIPRAFIGLLGIGPIAIGAKQLFDLHREGKTVSGSPARRGGARGRGQTATVAVVTLANGGDNIGAYAPAFAVRSGQEILIIGLVFIVMTALWCYLAHGMVQHPQLGAPIRQFGRYVAPFILMGLGILILYEARSFAMLLRH